MRLRVLVFLPLLILACTCANSLPISETIAPSNPRVHILMRDIAWLDDTVPVLRFSPPYVYGAWRLMIEQCSGLKREGWPTFYIAPFSPISVDSIPSVGYYNAGKIVLAMGEESKRSTVSHELLHWLLEPTLPLEPNDETQEEREVRLHPPEFFERRCRVALR